MNERLNWDDLRGGALRWEDGQPLEIDGWIDEANVGPDGRYAVITQIAECCLACIRLQPDRALEIFMERSETAPVGPVLISGRWKILHDDPNGWRFQLVDARVVLAATLSAPTCISANQVATDTARVRTSMPDLTAPNPSAPRISRPRRGFLTGALLGLAAAAGGFARAEDTNPGSTTAAMGATPAPARPLVVPERAVDMHSHAARVLIGRSGTERAFGALAAPMTQGGMAIVCLAVVSDSPTTRTVDHRITAYRDPAPGELYEFSQRSFARLDELVRSQNLAVITDLAGFDAASPTHPSVIVTSEGADFLEGQLDRVDEAYSKHQLRHLQLTHYRVNDLGDIQTEAPVHNGLTDFGASVIKRCNTLGIVVDVAHGTLDLVRRAVDVTKKPLILSHTSLNAMPGPRSRRISPDHAKLIARTGGVVGIWPPTSEFPSIPLYAQGIARMADVIGADHVGFGTDMLGLLVPACFGDYRELPQVCEALQQVGFSDADIRKIAGENYARVFRATLA